MLQVQYMFLIMLPFGAFTFLWANAVVIKRVGEVQIKSIGKWLIYINVKLYSNLFLIHVMGTLNKISKEPFILSIIANILKPR